MGNRKFYPEATMAEFCTDIRDIMFVLFEQCGAEKLFGYPKYEGLDRATFEAIIEEANKFATTQLAPMNAAADQFGSVFDKSTGEVKLPEAFKPSYTLFADNGWLALNHSPDFGGQGMPYSLALSCNDFFFGACLSFCLQGLLTTGAAHLVEVFGTDALKQAYVEKMYTGKWAGTMCLTEAGAGSDVGACRTRAIKQDDHYLIEGEKIFISFGEHDLTDNIIHAVLARVEGAPAGSRGLSLFLVPKIRINDDGSLGEANDVKCTGIEHKMGIHASPTCTLMFGENGACKGWLLGEENKGMRAMFQMMNEARISVGLQGAAIANAAYQFALQYAKERVQSKDLSGKTRGAVPIIEHPDVKRLLLWQKAIGEGCRALLIRTAFYADCAEASGDDDERKKNHGLVELLTPVCKAYASDMGFRSTELSLQTLGGYGYIAEYPVEQYLRDNKIASIYEGTNGIQALDLVGRKLVKNAPAFQGLMGTMAKLDGKNADHPVLGKDLAVFAEARGALVAAAMHLAKAGAEDHMVPIANATPFLELFGNVCVGWLLLEQAVLAHPRLQGVCEQANVDPTDGAALATLCADNDEARYYDGKLKVAQFWARQSLAKCRAEADIIMSGDRTLLDVNL